jgi:hypothetical protein
MRNVGEATASSTHNSIRLPSIIIFAIVAVNGSSGRGDVFLGAPRSR